jgi:glycosyltransferase involved in cell wall biosynthesis
MKKSVDVVIIGLNSARTLEDCINSVRGCRYPQDSLRIFYADGGSLDGSVSIAERLGAVVLEVASDSPSPGRQRNAGWRAGAGEFIQFLDSDTVMDPDWLQAGIDSFSDDIGAVYGNVKERYPEKSWFNWIGDKEWNGKSGDIEYFGGMVLIRRKVLEQTGGYDSALIAGEDPELAYRVRSHGARIVKIDARMTLHDLAMYRAAQYWKRSSRSGYAYAEVNRMHKEFWRGEVRRIIARGGSFFVGVLFLPLAFSHPWLGFIPVIATLLLLRPRILKVGYFMSEMALSRREASSYAWHASLVVLPQCFGVLRYWWGQAFGCPLTNKRAKKRR